MDKIHEAFNITWDKKNIQNTVRKFLRFPVINHSRERIQKMIYVIDAN